jgi:glycerol uptake facilitator protein
MNAALGRRLLAEFVGSTLLVIFGAGALVAALETGQGELDYAGLGIVAISFALVVAAVVYADGPPSPPSMLTSVPITANVTVRSTSITGTSTHI